MARTILHLDLDAFFVAVERMLDPSLEGKPVIVGGNPRGRGVVAACSYEARKFGLHSAMPIRQAFKLCPQGIYLHGHHDEYVLYSRAVKNIILRNIPFIEQASIDEFYIDYTGCKNIYGMPINFSSSLQKEIFKELGITCSIGIASNKTTAKIASDYNKPGGITSVLPGYEKDFLAGMAVEAIPGVGKMMIQSLHNRGIYRISDITKLPQDYFASAYGKFGIDIWRKANGEGSQYLSAEHQQKSISKETTFSEDVMDKKLIEDTLFRLTGKVCQSLRDENLVASTISIKLRYSDFQTLHRSKTTAPTDDDNQIFNIAVALLRKAYTRRVACRLIGIEVSKFSVFTEQEFLFEDIEIKRKKILRAINKVRDRYGYDSIEYGC